MKKLTAVAILLVFALVLTGCGAKSSANEHIADGSEMPNNGNAADTEKTGSATAESVSVTGGVDGPLSVENKPDEPGAGEYAVTIAKTMDEIENGIVLSESEAVSLCTAIANAEGENGWVNDISKCAVSCCISVETANEKTLYNYCDYGILDDTENIKSLELTESSKNTVNGILSKYITLTDAIPKEGAQADAADETGAEDNELCGLPLAPEGFTKP